MSLAALSFLLASSQAGAGETFAATAKTLPDCSGAAITIAGNEIKHLGDALEVRYCLTPFSQADDLYLSVQLPDNSLLFLQSDGSFFNTPIFLDKVAPYRGDARPALTLSILPMGLPTGTYIFYVIPVSKGSNVMNGFNWGKNTAQAKITLTR